MPSPPETASERRKRQSAKRRVLQRDGMRCHYCGCEMISLDRTARPWPSNAATIDHVTPKVNGGETVDDNLVACCYGCNLAKGRNERVAA